MTHSPVADTMHGAKAGRNGVPAHWPLVGRDAERTAILEAIAAGARAGVVIAGQAGVGKSRLAQEALREAEQRQCCARWIVATKATSSIPFGPFAHLLPASLGTSASRLDLLRQIVQVLVTGASGRQLVVGVDDAHLLDDASAALVHQLAVTGAAFVVVTLRAGEEAPDSIVALWKDGLAERLDLEALSERDVGDLLPRVLGGQVETTTIARIWGATLGNALFLRELVLAGLDAGELVEADGVWGWKGPMAMSTRLQELVAARLGALDAGRAALLEVLAHGEPMSVSVLEKLFPPAALEGTERRGVVTVQLDGRRMLVRLAHPLYGEVMRARCPSVRARTIHGQLAAALEATGARRGGDLLRLATFRLESGEPGRPDLLLAGAQRAFARFDLALSERLARTAADAGGGLPATLAIARALGDQGRAAEVVELLREVDALDLTEAETVMVATLRAWALWMGLGRPAEAEHVLECAEERVGDADLRDELRAMRAAVLSMVGQPYAAIAAALPVLARDGASQRASLTAAVTAVFAWGAVGAAEKAVALADRWIEPARRLADEMPFAVFELRAAESYALCLAGRLAEARAIAEEGHREAVSRNTDELVGMWASLLGLVALSRGRVQAATRWLREAVTVVRGPSRVNHLPMCLIALGQTLVHAGDLATAEATLAAAEAGMTPALAQFDPWLRLAQAWLAAGRGELSRGRELALEAAGMAEKQRQHAVVVVALHDLARLDDPRPSRLSDAASLVDGPFASACALHAAALTSRDGARLDEAAAAFATMGADLLAAEAASEAAAAHRADGSRGSTLASSARARLHLEVCEGARSPALDAQATPQLTRREREVAALADSGLTSAEIASRLVLSTRTVEGHLQRAYAKLGVSSRNELRSVLRRPGTAFSGNET